MNQLRVTYEDQEYEFVGYYKEQGGTHYLTQDGVLYERDQGTQRPGTAWFRRVPVRHIFGGIVFEETGVESVGMEKGQAGILIQTGNVVIAVHDIKITYDTKYRILRRVEVTDAPDD